MCKGNDPSFYECPYCQHKLTMKEAVHILRGGCNFPKIARVLLPDGRIALCEVGQVFPILGEILDDDYKVDKETFEGYIDLRKSIKVARESSI
jgi:hypothetical protein